MRIKHLSITNFKGARRVEVHGADVNEIAGQNGSGKTSVLDAIVAALAGKRHIDPKPLTDGTIKGEVQVDLGDITVRRTFNEKGGGTLKVTNAEGDKLGQTHLDNLLGEFTFDPLAFSQMAGPAQADVLRKLAGPDWNATLTMLDQDIANAETERRDMGRDIKKFGTLPNLQPVERIDVARLMNELEAIKAHNAGLHTIERERDQHAASRDRAAQEVARCQMELKRIQEQLKLAEEAVWSFNDKLAGMPDEQELQSEQEVTSKLAAAAEVNARAAQYGQNETRRAELRSLEGEHAKTERTLDTKRQERLQHLRSAPLPVPGLDWGPEGVTVDGIPMLQVNFTKRLLLGTAIGHAVSGALQVCMIREHGGSIVGASWDALLEWCRAHEVQLWVETAGDGHSGEALVIEEGELESFADEEL